MPTLIPHPFHPCCPPYSLTPVGDVLTEMAGSPEVLDESYGLPCDLWSVGVMLYCLLTGHPPFQHASVLKLFDMVKSEPLDFTSGPWAGVSRGAKDLLSQLLQRDPTKRVTATEALGESEWQHAYTHTLHLTSKYDVYNHWIFLSFIPTWYLRLIARPHSF